MRSLRIFYRIFGARRRAAACTFKGRGLEKRQRSSGKLSSCLGVRYGKVREERLFGVLRGRIARTRATKRKAKPASRLVVAASALHM